MSKRTWQTPNPLLHRLEPIGEGLAWRRKINVSCPPSQRSIGDICFKTVRLGDVMVRQTGLLVMSNGRATTQIPIVRRLS